MVDSLLIRTTTVELIFNVGLVSWCLDLVLTHARFKTPLDIAKAGIYRAFASKSVSFSFSYYPSFQFQGSKDQRPASLALRKERGSVGVTRWLNLVPKASAPEPRLCANSGTTNSSRSAICNVVNQDKSGSLVMSTRGFGMIQRTAYPGHGYQGQYKRFGSSCILQKPLHLLR